jgi:hypothetical protein
VARADAVMQVRTENAVAHDVSFLAFNALVIEVERAATAENSSVIYNVDAFVTNLCVQFVRKN